MKKTLSKVAHNQPKLFFSVLPTSRKPVKISNIFHRNPPPHDFTIMNLYIGKLFEPRDLATNDLVIDYARGITNSVFWLGIDDIDNEGTFQYATGGNLVFTNWEGGQPDNSGGAQNCGITRIVHIKKWDDFQCDFKFVSICEMI